MKVSDSINGLELTPLRHLQLLPDGAWRSTGNDPGFQCEVSGLHLIAGWYEVVVEIEHLSGPSLRAFLYPDYGDDNPEMHRVFLPFVGEGVAMHRGVVLFLRDVHALRFDPAMSSCEFRLGALKLRRIGKGIASCQMLSGIWRSPETRALDVGRLLKSGLLGGFRGFGEELYSLYMRQSVGFFVAPYQDWLDLYDSWTPKALNRARRTMAGQSGAPRISVVLPVYNAPEKWLVKAIDSVIAQVYSNWELCIANDASTAPHVRRVLDRYSRDDKRIRVVHRSVNGHISASSNSAAELATGEWIALLDHDDELHPMALAEVAAAVDSNPRWRVIYTDEDKISESGRRFDPYMKSDWNYDLFLSHNCISHLGVYHTALFREIGGFRLGMEGSQDWDLALRAVERLDSDQIGHISKVLYHWRAIQGSTALAPQEKDYAHEAGLRAIGQHLDRIGNNAIVESIPGLRGSYRVRYPVPDPAPLVSIVVPTRDGLELLRTCVESVLSLTTYPCFEILIVDNQSSDPGVLEYLGKLQSSGLARVLVHDEPFNYARLNNAAVEAAFGTVLCFLNNDITVLTPGWLEEMVAHACRPGVGAVGAMLYYPNDTIQHAGVVIGVHGVAAHVYAGHARGSPGHMSRARLTQTLSAVTAACMVVRRDAFEAVEGFDPALGVAFNDVDLCLRLAVHGLRNVWTPFAELYHHESASRGLEDSPEKKARFEKEVGYMRARWSSKLDNDPYYSRSFTVDEAPCQLAFPPRWSWCFDDVDAK